MSGGADCRWWVSGLGLTCGAEVREARLSQSLCTCLVPRHMVLTGDSFTHCGTFAVSEAIFGH